MNLRNAIKLILNTFVFTHFYIAYGSFCENSNLRLFFDPDTVNGFPQVYCALNKIGEHCSSSELEFLQSNQQTLKHSIINSTYIQLTVSQDVEANLNVTCRHKRNHNLSETKEIKFVENLKPPRPVKNFRCFSKNLENLYCNFDKNETDLQNGESTEYHISANNSNCEPLVVIDDQYQCTLNTRRYIKEHRFVFQINMSNFYGEYTQISNLIEPQKVVIFNKPELSVEKIFTDGALILTTVNELVFPDYDYGTSLPPFKISAKPFGLLNESWKDINYTVSESEIQQLFQECNVPIRIVGLRYANFLYNVSIRYRVNDAVYPDLQWSEPSYIKFQTVADIPKRPPETHRSAIEYLHRNHIKIYWKELLKEEWNGNNFQYDIILNEEQTHSPKVYMTVFNASTAEILDIDNRTSYIIRLISKNEIGSSINYSQIDILPLNLRPEPPTLYPIQLEDGVYNMTWKYSTISSEVDNFTIFWCKALNENNKLCDKLMNFWTITGHENSFQFNETDERGMKNIFAISANRNGISSGMVWFPCTISSKLPLGQVQNPKIDFSESNDAKLSWSVPCDSPAKLVNFRICYSIFNILSCIDNGTTIHASYDRENIMQSIIIKSTKLKALTNYHFQIEMYDGLKYGPPTIIHKTTNSLRPTIPNYLKIITSDYSSIEVQWLPPHEWNGYPLKYELNLNGSHIDIDIANGSKFLNYTLRNLNSTSKYEIKVRAVNVDNDHKSLASDYAKIDAWTTIQTGPVQNIAIKENNIVRWEPPIVQSGPISFYEVHATIIEVKGTEPLNIQIGILNSTLCTINVDLCKFERFEVKVRAVNMEVKKSEIKEKISRKIYSKIFCEENFSQSVIQIYDNQCQITHKCIPGQGTPSNSQYCNVSIPWYVFVGAIVGILIFLITIYVGTIRFKKNRESKTKPFEILIPPGLSNTFKNNNCQNTKYDIDLDKNNTIKNKSTKISLNPNEEEIPDKNYKIHDTTKSENFLANDINILANQSSTNSMKSISKNPNFEFKNKHEVNEITISDGYTKNFHLMHQFKNATVPRNQRQNETQC